MGESTEMQNVGETIHKALIMGLSSKCCVKL